WWTRGDLDGFFGLFVDNLIQLILIAGLCSWVLGFPDDLVYGRIFPGIAISLLIGNIYYAFQAKKLTLSTGKRATALPYGVNTVSLFAYILFVMKPVIDRTGDPELAWAIGLAACFGSGVIEILGSFVVKWIKKVTPRAALLATLAGIAISFIAMDFSFRIFNDPIVGFAPLAIIFIQYIGRKKLPANIPAGLVAVIVGTALAWAMPGRMDAEALAAAATVDFHFPMLSIGALVKAVTSPYMLEFLPVIIPMGLFNLMGSLQNLESAEAAGDTYSPKSSLIMNGVGTLAASMFGSTFPTTIYIGHPGWKGMGAGAGYSIANGLVITLLAILGLIGFTKELIPIEAGAAILLWIGITIAAQAFQATPREHAPAVVIGFFPALAAWGLLVASSVARASGKTLQELFTSLNRDMNIGGLIALDRGFIFTSMILAAMTVAVIEKKFTTAALWSLAAAVLSAIGLIHGYAFDAAGNVINAYGPSATWPFVIGYVSIAGIFAAMQMLYVKRVNEDPI
ncbi:MAG: NCS2 family permease, partial [Leptospirales bacterium]